MSDSLPAITRRPLGEIVDAKRGLTYSADQLVDTSEAGLAYYNMKSFRKDGGLNRDGVKWFSGIVPPEFILSEKDIVVANTDVTPGSDIIGCAVATPAEHAGKATFSHHVTRLRVKDPVVSPRFLGRALLHESVRRAMRAESRGTTVKMLDMQGALQIPITILPPDEQDYSVWIFDTLDTAIRETEAIIAKLTAVKQGLLHDLLTRGIDANGELRPPQAQASHLYKQSPLGWIPKEWEIVTISTMADILDKFRVPVNESDRSKRLGTVPYYGANGQQGWIDKPIFNEPLILLAEDGGNFDDFASRPIAYRIDGPSWVNNHAHVIRAKPDCCQSFLFFCIEHRDIRAYISGGTRTKLTASELKAIEMPRPPMFEQNSIASRLEAIETRLQSEGKMREKLSREKVALMDDLLTGRVRVTPLLSADRQAQHRSA